MTTMAIIELTPEEPFLPRGLWSEDELMNDSRRYSDSLSGCEDITLSHLDFRMEVNRRDWWGGSWHVLNVWD